MSEPPSDLVAKQYKNPRFAREDEIEELLTALRQPDATPALAADVAGIDRKRAVALIHREIARVITQPHINGNISGCAAEMNLSYKTVWNLIQSNGYLRTVNGATDPAKKIPDSEEALEREALTEGELTEMRALIKTDKALSSLQWEKLGLSPERAARLMEIEEFARGSLRSSLDLTHGGMLRCFAEMLDLFVTTKQMYDSDALPIEEGEFGPKDSKKEYSYVLASLSAEIRNINLQVQRSNLLKLKVEELEMQKRGTTKRAATKKAKPGFTDGPPPVLVQVNSTGPAEVKVSEASE